MNNNECIDISLVFEALQLAAIRHKNQTRKGNDKEPYINHLIHVAKLLVQIGNIRDTDLIIAALLHDIIEDTVENKEDSSKLEELIRCKFGEKVLQIVLEVTDDKQLPKHIRKRLQIVGISEKSKEAKILKIADKISNVMDVLNNPPQGWSEGEIQEYIAWSEQVVAGARGTNVLLEKLFYEIINESKSSSLNALI